ncbi:hypothetical protein HYU19_05350 [Candidatus Woesearchaeota archaeon]|nr:hypothetical protein [Candidatus Woesearchaeota archaeon]
MNQDLVDSAIPVLNRMIAAHNRRHPKAQLRPFPKRHRIVHVLPRKELEDRIEMDFSSTVAIFNGKAGRIYVARENVQQEIDLYAEVDNRDFTPTTEIPNTHTLRLVHILAHENMHRSCIQRGINGRVAEFFKEAYAVLCSEAGNKEYSSLLASDGTRVFGHGWNLLFEAKDGRGLSRQDHLNEFVTDYFTARIAGSYLAGRGCYPTAEMAFYALAIHRVVGNPDAFDSALSYMEHAPISDGALLHDYLSSRMPQKCADTFLQDGQNRTHVQAAYGIMLGMLRFLPQVIETMYGNGAGNGAGNRAGSSND